MQAIMEIINRQEYISWRFPKNTTLILTENPDNGTYNTSSMDEAQKSRYMRFDLKFDVNCWSRFAENTQIDGRAINFMLAYNNEIMKENAQHRHPVNARNYTMFANTISGIEDWENPKSLALILQIASGAFLDDKDNVIGSLFTNFIANKLDKLISPEELLTGDWKKVAPKIEKCVYDEKGKYKPLVASILHTRLLNYSMYYFDQKGAKTEVVEQRLIDLISTNDDPDKKMLFSEDFLFDIIKQLVSKYKSRTNKLLLNAKIREKIL